MWLCPNIGYLDSLEIMKSTGLSWFSIILSIVFVPVLMGQFFLSKFKVHRPQTLGFFGVWRSNLGGTQGLDSYHWNIACLFYRPPRFDGEFRPPFSGPPKKTVASCWFYIPWSKRIISMRFPWDIPLEFLYILIITIIHLSIYPHENQIGMDIPHRIHGEISH